MWVVVDERVAEERVVVGGGFAVVVLLGAGVGVVVGDGTEVAGEVVVTIVVVTAVVGTDLVACEPLQADTVASAHTAAKAAVRTRRRRGRNAGGPAEQDTRQR